MSLPISSHLKYRAYVDGLRAVAVLPVLFFHANLGFTGGYVGVDIFFVISGYLCRVEEGGKALYWDDNHLTVAGAMMLRPLFEPIFEGFGKIMPPPFQNPVGAEVARLKGNKPETPHAVSYGSERVSAVN